MGSLEEERVAGALVGMALGDALAMPVHWYYDVRKLRAAVGSVDGMLAPSATHPESMLSGMSYMGAMDILHDKAKFYNEASRASWSAKDVDERSDGHGNFVGRREADRVHYHQSLRKGQNTATVAIARLATRYLGSRKDDYAYKPEEYLDQLVEYMLTAPDKADVGQLRNHDDTYLDVWVRRFFTSASVGVPLAHCAPSQRESWSIGSLDGVVMAVPVVAAYRRDPSPILVARAIEHHSLTHRSVAVSAGVAALAPLLHGLFLGVRAPDDLVLEAMRALRLPAITGPEMRESYVTHRGPGNIPKPIKWQQHMVFSQESLADFCLAHLDDDLADVAGWAVGTARLSTACYVEHALAISLYLALRFKDDAKAALKANAELGGHSTARGAVLGAILGARLGLANLPQDWLADLADPDQVIREAKAVAANPLS